MLSGVYAGIILTIPMSKFIPKRKASRTCHALCGISGQQHGQGLLVQVLPLTRNHPRLPVSSLRIFVHWDTGTKSGILEDRQFGNLYIPWNSHGYGDGMAPIWDDHEILIPNRWFSM